MWPFNWEYIKGTAVSKCPFAMPSVDMNGLWPLSQRQSWWMYHFLVLGQWSGWTTQTFWFHQTWKASKIPKTEGFFMGTSWNIMEQKSSIFHCYGNDYRQPNRPNLAISGDVVWGHCMSLHVIAPRLPVKTRCHTVFLLAKSPSYSCNIPIKSPLFLVYHHVWLKLLSFNSFFPGKCQFWLVNSPLKQHDHNMIWPRACEPEQAYGPQQSQARARRQVVQG